MNETTYVILGGGYAGLHAIKAIRKAWNKDKDGELKLILVDKNDHHLRKVLLFKPAAKDERIKIPFSELLEEGVQFVCGEVMAVEAGERTVHVRYADGAMQPVHYDRLIIALGSIVCRPAADRGGYPLTSVEDAFAIRAAWRANLQQAVKESDEQLRRSLLTIAIAGAGLSGIETAAELAHYVRQEAQAIGLAAHEASIVLCNAHSGLLEQISGKLSRRLVEELHRLGVRIMHNSTVKRAQNGAVEFTDGRIIEADICVWTTGLQPNPVISRLGLPITSEGKLRVNASYRVSGHQAIYSIGDGAHVEDPRTGRCDGNTCREAIAQAARLAKVLQADHAGQSAPVHEPALEAYCFSLGPERAIVWVNKWGLDMILSGKLGWRIRQYTWDSASLLV